MKSETAKKLHLQKLVIRTKSSAEKKSIGESMLFDKGFSIGYEPTFGGIVCVEEKL